MIVFISTMRLSYILIRRNNARPRCHMRLRSEFQFQSSSICVYIPHSCMYAQILPDEARNPFTFIQHHTSFAKLLLALSKKKRDPHPVLPEPLKRPHESGTRHNLQQNSPKSPLVPCSTSCSSRTPYFFLYASLIFAKCRGSQWKRTRRLTSRSVRSFEVSARAW